MLHKTTGYLTDFQDNAGRSRKRAQSRTCRTCIDCGSSFDGRNAWVKKCDDCSMVVHKGFTAGGAPIRPLMRRAYYLLYAARLPMARLYACVDCGRQASTYDHRDYYRPLDVVPVCGGCNVKRGPGYPYDQERADA